MHDREILQRCDDSVMALVDGAPQLIRRARGFVPLAVPLPGFRKSSPPLLAVGGHLKNVFALARGRFAYQSQHLGDLENLTGLNFFRESLAHLMRTFEIEPQAVVHDLHPGYLSTTLAKEWAAERGLPLIAVQHHHAHIAACMAEHALDGPGHRPRARRHRLRNRWQDLGRGSAHRVGSTDFERFAHLDYVPMPGGEAAIREPWRMALGRICTRRASTWNRRRCSRCSARSSRKRTCCKRMIERELEHAAHLKLGRLFDAVAAVVLGRGVVDYEAQAAIELEGVAVDRA